MNFAEICFLEFRPVLPPGSQSSLPAVGLCGSGPLLIRAFLVSSRRYLSSYRQPDEDPVRLSVSQLMVPLRPCSKSGARLPLALLVSPVSLLAFTDPIDGSDDALVPCLCTLGLCDPLEVFPFATGAEGGKSGGGRFIGLERPGEFGWCFDSRRG